MDRASRCPSALDVARSRGACLCQVPKFRVYLGSSPALLLVPAAAPLAARAAAAAASATSMGQKRGHMRYNIPTGSLIRARSNEPSMIMIRCVPSSVAVPSLTPTAPPLHLCLTRSNWTWPVAVGAAQEAPAAKSRIQGVLVQVGDDFGARRAACTVAALDVSQV